MVEGAVEAEASNPQINQESFSATSMEQNQTIPRTTAQKRKRPSTEWKMRRRQRWSVTQAGLDRAKHTTHNKHNIKTFYPRATHTTPPHKPYLRHHLSTPSNHPQPLATIHTQPAGNTRSQTLKGRRRNLRTLNLRKSSPTTSRTSAQGGEPESSSEPAKPIANLRHDHAHIWGLLP